MLFTLRLLPITKKWPRKVIYVTFAFNLAITLIAVVSYGIKCTPLQANYKNVPGGHCSSPEVNTATQQVNGSKSCVNACCVAEGLRGR